MFLSNFDFPSSASSVLLLLHAIARAGYTMQKTFSEEGGRLQATIRLAPPHILLSVVGLSLAALEILFCQRTFLLGSVRLEEICKWTQVDGGV